MAIIGKTPDVAKWRVSLTLFEIQTLHFKWTLLLDQSGASSSSVVTFAYNNKFILQIEYNDRPNAELIIKSKKNADLVIKSVDS